MNKINLNHYKKYMHMYVQETLVYNNLGLVILLTYNISKKKKLKIKTIKEAFR